MYKLKGRCLKHDSLIINDICLVWTLVQRQLTSAYKRLNKIHFTKFQNVEFWIGDVETGNLLTVQ